MEKNGLKRTQYIHYCYMLFELCMYLGGIYNIQHVETYVKFEKIILIDLSVIGHVEKPTQICHTAWMSCVCVCGASVPSGHSIFNFLLMHNRYIRHMWTIYSIYIYTYIIIYTFKVCDIYFATNIMLNICTQNINKNIPPGSNIWWSIISL